MRDFEKGLVVVLAVLLAFLIFPLKTMGLLQVEEEITMNKDQIREIPFIVKNNTGKIAKFEVNPYFPGETRIEMEKKVFYLASQEEIKGKIIVKNINPGRYTGSLVISLDKKKETKEVSLNVKDNECLISLNFEEKDINGTKEIVIKARNNYMEEVNFLVRRVFGRDVAMQEIKLKPGEEKTFSTGLEEIKKEEGIEFRCNTYNAQKTFFPERDKQTGWIIFGGANFGDINPIFWVNTLLIFIAFILGFTLIRSNFLMRVGG